MGLLGEGFDHEICKCLSGQAEKDYSFIGRNKQVKKEPGAGKQMNVSGMIRQ